MRVMSDLWSAINDFFLDVAPVAALAALAVTWGVRKKRMDREEEELRSRIKEYEEQTVRERKSTPGSG